MDLTFIGPGRLGRSLATLLASAGHTVRLVGRGEPLPACEVALLTVPDAAIPEVAAGLPPCGVVLHCSGAAEVDVLRPHRPAGSLHPLMTFPGPEVGIPDLRGVPAAVAGDPEAVAVARALAEDLGLAPFHVPGDRRLYHAAAVMAGNFATVLLAEASQVLVQAGVSPEQASRALAPLALASLQNAAPDPAAALTGPAARGDTVTIEKHRQALEAHGLTEALALYDHLTERARALVASSRIKEGAETSRS